MTLQQIEFRQTPEGEVEVTNKVSGIFFQLTERNTDFIQSFIEQFQEDYPKKFENLKQRYKKCKENRRYFEFMVVRGFIKCNLGTSDNHLDIDENGNINFEYIQCPLAGECKEWKETCNNATRNTVISKSEVEVLKLIAKGLKTDKIAEMLCKSRYTIENQTNSMLRKTGLHNNASLIAYAYENHIIK